MKKSIFFILFNLLIAYNLDFNLNNSYIKYTGNHPLHSWVGITKQFNIDIQENNDFFTIFISTKLNSFDSNNENRDSNMLYYTESLKYPVVSFKSEKIYFSKINQTKLIQGKLNFHGIEKNINAKVEISESDKNIIGQCNFTIKLSEFNIERPKLLMLSIEDDIIIEAKIEFLK